MNDGSIIMLNTDMKLYPHHTDRERKYDFSMPVATVSRYPTNLSTWALRNLSSERWFVEGSKQEVMMGQSIILKAGTTIDFGNRTGKIYAAAKTQW
jgi:hypothetical protein